MAKPYLKILGGALGITALALGITWFSRNAILESTLEGSLKDATGVETQIEGVNFQPFTGDLRIETITLNNPEGFSSPHLLMIKDLALKFELSQLLADPVVLEALTIKDLDLKVEQQIPDNNLIQVIDKLQGPENSPSSDQPPKVVKIGRLALGNIKASIKVSALGDLGLDQEINLGDIELNNVSSEDAEGQISVAIANLLTTTLLEKIPQQDLPFQLDGKGNTPAIPPLEDFLP
ncbi:MAG: hypothetical protein HC934_05105 [Acaryochloridaceae cyanobacterium SU_2_1]|nr:hypothetical protein [Acaryochloridaceae cyanobacterium SU_2_1]NJM95185.1 hypothetical protein [Acaryochloridaceae cyanobacterium CSU_5_19]